VVATALTSRKEQAGTFSGSFQDSITYSEAEKRDEGEG
jgi:hypothetical protein